ncbi:hypothetical protein DC366_17060 [Pelagivirga sediminicola]|uniref:SAM-dependent methyltransferase n=1 Tax=Pelagivirga sediminicola TaxID=2170575 RepID=A0A2T7G304_9RHOB|nr:hypothetical protein [Pelagivirga sediminicola]PVA08809.1 hypothetical protein DC366_17060 [Pelagivirga sediminicola]
MSDTLIKRPELTLPEAEAARVAKVYGEADVILEYGSGGSTVMASQLSGKTVFSVESDQAWAKMMQDWFVQNPPATGTQVDVMWVNIGETGDWGKPVDTSGWRHYPQYPLAVWQSKGFRQPDVVLVDGRFRPGCAMATAFCTQKPVTLLVDDYKRRKGYHAIEEFLGTPRLTGRMAEFDVVPMAVPPDRLLPIIKMMMRP